MNQRQLQLTFIFSIALVLSCSAPVEINTPTINVDTLPTEHIVTGQNKLLFEKAVNMANDPTIDSAGYGEVIAILDQIIAVDPDYPNVFRMKASCQEISGVAGFSETEKIAGRKEVEHDLFVAVAGKRLEDNGDTASARAYYEHIIMNSTHSLDTMTIGNPNRFQWEIDRIVSLLCLGKNTEASNLWEREYASNLDLLQRDLLKHLRDAAKSDLYNAITEGAWPEEKY